VAAAALELSPACPRPRLSRVRDQGVRQGDYGTCFDTRAPGCGRSPETNLKTPIAISVPTADTIRERHAQSLLDLADDGALHAAYLPMWSAPPGRPEVARGERRDAIRRYVADISAAANLPPCVMSERGDWLYIASG